LAYLASSSGVLPGSVEDAVQVYFRQCSVLVTTEDVAVMAATLANGGINPVTDQRVIDENVARSTMSVMATCGMYDDSGEWMVRVGLPAKSGVGGGIAAVRPSEFGIGVFSPRLDERGNSARGIAVLEDLSSAFGLHLLAHPSEPRSPIFVSGRQTDESVVELRGEIDFIAAEQVVHHIRELATDLGPGGGTVCVDFTSVTRVNPGAEGILAVVIDEFARKGVDLVVIDPAGVGAVGGSNVSG
jgi:glutaminase